MSTILASASNADGATTTSSAFQYDVTNVVTATCANSSTSPPSQACQVTLQLSADNTTYYSVDRKWFGLGAGNTYVAKFELSDYVERNLWYALSSPWAYFKLVFSGNVGAAVTIAATDSSVKQMAVVALTATTSTGGGKVANWTPPEGGPILITRATLYVTTVSTGAATVTVGVAANATTSNGNLITTMDVHSSTGAFDNYVNASTSGKASQLLATTSVVTATGSADTTGLVGFLIIEYTRLPA